MIPKQEMYDANKAEHKEIVSKVRQMDYGMKTDEFVSRMYDLFPDGNPAAMSSWILHIDETEAELSRPKAKTMLEYFVELGLIKQHYGDEIALRLFNLAEESCMNVFELRGAAKLLEDGVEISQVHEMVLENELYMTESEDCEFGKALIAFVEREYASLPMAIRPTEQQ